MDSCTQLFDNRPSPCAAYTGLTAERKWERKGEVCIMHVAVANEASQEWVVR